MNASNTSFFEHLVYESHSSGQSSSDDDDVLQAHLEGDTDVEELFPVPDEEELVEEPRMDKTAMIRQARSKDAKAKAIKIRQVKQRAAAGTTEDTFVLSDSCSDDNKEIIDLDDHDGAVLESKISMRKRKSRAMPVKKRTYYDESKSSGHDQHLHRLFLQLQLMRSLVPHVQRLHAVPHQLQLLQGRLLIPLQVQVAHV
ncbi:hypothetical protein ZWY2020_059688 [Hordeum vulgare]|nr:hypothetical protein ZWY2020_059688 [Hordeum vulgare]